MIYARLSCECCKGIDNTVGEKTNQYLSIVKDVMEDKPLRCRLGKKARTTLKCALWTTFIVFPSVRLFLCVNAKFVVGATS